VAVAGTTFAYDGETVTIVKMATSGHGNEILVDQWIGRTQIRQARFAMIPRRFQGLVATVVSVGADSSALRRLVGLSQLNRFRGRPLSSSAT